MFSHTLSENDTLHQRGFFATLFLYLFLSLGSPGDYRYHGQSGFKYNLCAVVDKANLSHIIGNIS